MKYVSLIAIFLGGCVSAPVPVKPLKSFKHEEGPCKIRKSEFYNILPPKYPQEAMAIGQEGWVVLKFDVENGRAKDIQILDSSPSGVFDESSIVALENSQFKPGLYQEGCVALREFSFD